MCDYYYTCIYINKYIVMSIIFPRKSNKITTLCNIIYNAMSDNCTDCLYMISNLIFFYFVHGSIYSRTCASLFVVPCPDMTNILTYSLYSASIRHQYQADEEKESIEITFCHVRPP